MSSMIKKKGALSFKPKAPQPRKPRAPPSTTSSARQTIERQSQTPAPQTVRVSATSPPPSNVEQPEALRISDPKPITPTDPEETPNDNTQIRTRAQSAAIASSTHNHDEPHEMGRPGDRNKRAAAEVQTQAKPSVPTVVESIDKSGDATTSRRCSTSDGVVTTALADAEVTDVDLSTMGPGESLVPEQQVPMARLNPDGTSGDINPAQSKRPRKRRKIDASTDVRPSIEVQLDVHPRSSGARARRSRKAGTPGSKKRRDATPEGAEEEEIDHSTIKMAELCKDLKIGKKSSRHDEIKQREIQRRVQAKLARDHPELVAEHEKQSSASSPGLGGEVESGLISSAGPRLRLVQGQIVIDEGSLVVDRHKDLAAATADLEVVEEDEFTRLTTSSSYMKREKNILWDHASTEKFYMGLRMFGTSFEMIAEMFPDRNRKQIKLKFNKEERAFPTRINAALIGERVTIDFDEFKKHTGREYESIEDIHARMAVDEAEHLSQQQAHQARLDEATRRKKAAIHDDADTSTRKLRSSDAPAAGTESSKENNEPEEASVRAAEGRKASAASKSKKATGRKRRNLHSIRGGEEVEILGTI